MANMRTRTHIQKKTMRPGRQVTKKEVEHYHNLAVLLVLDPEQSIARRKVSDLRLYRPAHP